MPRHYGRAVRAASDNCTMLSSIPDLWSPGSTPTGRLASRAYETIKDRLISGQFAHGSRLSVEQLREELGTSKQPVMEALRLLSADGIVEIIPQVGCQVASYSSLEVVDFFTMFGGFEGAIAAAAAARRTDPQLAEMESGVGAFERLGEIVEDSYRSRRYFQLNHEFHQQIHRMSGSRIMSTTSRRMWDMCDFLINTTGPSEPMAHATMSRHAQHEAIRAALVAGDADLARSEMEHHIVATVDLILPRET